MSYFDRTMECLAVDRVATSGTNAAQQGGHVVGGKRSMEVGNSPAPPAAAPAAAAFGATSWSGMPPLAANSTISASSDPQDKRARTSYDVFVDQEMGALAEKQFVSRETLQHFDQGLAERWRSMSHEETQLYVDLLETELANASDDEAGGEQGRPFMADEQEVGVQKFSPGLKAALVSFMSPKKRDSL